MRILQTEQDVTARQEAADDLAGRHSLAATQQLVAGATDSTAEAGLAALVEAYSSELDAAASKAVESGKGFDEKTTLRLEETVDCLACIGDAKAIDALGDFASTVGRSVPGILDLQRRCVEAIADLGTDTAVVKLVHVVSRIGTDQYSQVVATAAKDRLRAMGEPAAGVLIGYLGTEDWVPDILVTMGAPAVIRLEGALDASDPAARYLALGVLLQLYQKDSAAVTAVLVKPEMAPLLVQARCDAGYGDVRDDELESLLGEIGVPALGDLLDVVPENDWAGAVVVGWGADVVPELAAVVGAQPCAEELLAMIGAPAISEVVPLLDDSDEMIRHRAMGTLLRMYVYMVPEVDAVLLTADMVPRILQDLSSLTSLFSEYGDFDHVAWAETALMDTGEPAVAPVLASEYEWKWWVLQEMGSTAVPALLETMHGDNREDAIMAAGTLAMMTESSPSAVQSLTAALDDEDLQAIADDYLFYIALGRAGSEDVIARALNAHGKKQMALDCLNCGNETLDAAARTWARKHGYVVREGGEPGVAPAWGGGG